MIMNCIFDEKTAKMNRFSLLLHLQSLQISSSDFFIFRSAESEHIVKIFMFDHLFIKMKFNDRLLISCVTYFRVIMAMNFIRSTFSLEQ